MARARSMFCVYLVSQGARGAGNYVGHYHIRDSHLVLSYPHEREDGIKQNLLSVPESPPPGKYVSAFFTPVFTPYLSFACTRTRYALRINSAGR